MQQCISRAVFVCQTRGVTISIGREKVLCNQKRTIWYCNDDDSSITMAKMLYATLPWAVPAGTFTTLCGISSAWRMTAFPLSVLDSITTCLAAGRPGWPMTPGGLIWNTDSHQWKEYNAESLQHSKDKGTCRLGFKRSPIVLCCANFIPLATIKHADLSLNIQKTKTAGVLYCSTFATFAGSMLLHVIYVSSMKNHFNKLWN